MKVYRIAYGDINTGIWYNKPEMASVNVINALWTLQKEYPMPYDENFPKDYLCCCQSYDALKSFFGDYFQHLLEVGFVIYIYDIPDQFVRTYKTHCIADFSKGILVEIITKCGDNFD